MEMIGQGQVFHSAYFIRGYTGLLKLNSGWGYSTQVVEEVPSLGCSAQVSCSPTDNPLRSPQNAIGGII